MIADDPKMQNKIGCQIFCDRLNLWISLPLADNYRKFLIEQININYAVELVLSKAYTTTSVSILTNSQAATRSF